MDVQEFLEQLKAGRKDFTGVDLRGADLKKACLSSRIFIRANGEN
jgi:uncharacterized protein YjbI with pentapeptide repeats